MGISFIETHISGINFAIEVCCTIFTLVVLAALLFVKNRNSEIKSFIFYCASSAISTATDSINYLIAHNIKLVDLMYAMNIISYACSAFAAYAFYLYIICYFEERKKLRYNKAFKIVPFVYTAVSSLIYASSRLTHIAFYISDDGLYQTTKYTSTVVALIIPLVIGSAVLIIANRKLTSTRDTIIHIMYNISYVFLGNIDSRHTTAYHYVTMTILMFIILIFIGLERDRQLDVKSKELAISELNALRLQMNPHFVYNTLASIDGLITISPDSARDLIEKFTKHLRSSYLDNSPNLVPFEREIENIKCYLSVEEVRFPDISIIFDLKVTDFNIPPLTVQPIIENAIKHGVCKKEEGNGTIIISSYEDNKNYYVKIADDGVGFDVNAPKKDTQRAHIGLSNSKKRVELISEGTLNIKSEIGVGTEVLITIPKEK